ncbi:MAG: hypothetical protein Fur006_26280 [Coleofasciculaceae cyanobacterium]
MVIERTLGDKEDSWRQGRLLETRETLGDKGDKEGKEDDVLYLGQIESILLQFTQ